MRSPHETEPSGGAGHSRTPTGPPKPTYDIRHSSATQHPAHPDNPTIPTHQLAHGNNRNRVIRVPLQNPLFSFLRNRRMPMPSALHSHIRKHLMAIVALARSLGTYPDSLCIEEIAVDSLNLIHRFHSNAHVAFNHQLCESQSINEHDADIAGPHSLINVSSRLL